MGEDDLRTYGFCLLFYTRDWIFYTRDFFTQETGLASTCYPVDSLIIAENYRWQISNWGGNY